MFELSDRHWINSSSSCARLGLIQFKVMHRAHFSRARLADIYPGTDSSCMRCSLSPADLTHTFWLCPRLNQFWFSVFQTLSEVIKISESLTLTRNQSDVIAFASLLARRRILLVWASPTPPAVAAWLRDVLLF